MTDEPRDFEPIPDEADDAPLEDEQERVVEPDELEPEAQAQPTSDADLKKMDDRLEREAKRHRDRVSEIMGESAVVLEPCELCEPQLAGFHFPFELVPLDDEHKQRVLAAVGEAQPDMKGTPQAYTCEDCNGFGRVLTGSLVPEHRTINCPNCQGYGWTGDLRATGGIAPTPQTAAAPGNGQTPPPSTDLSAEVREMIEDLRARGITVIEPFVATTA